MRSWHDLKGLFSSFSRSFRMGIGMEFVKYLSIKLVHNVLTKQILLKLNSKRNLSFRHLNVTGE